MTRVDRELSVNIPPLRSKERRVSHVSCKLIKMRYGLDMQAYYESETRGITWSKT